MNRDYVIVDAEKQQTNICNSDGDLTVAMVTSNIADRVSTNLAVSAIKCTVDVSNKIGKLRFTNNSVSRTKINLHESITLEITKTGLLTVISDNPNTLTEIDCIQLGTMQKCITLQGDFDMVWITARHKLKIVLNGKINKLLLRTPDHIRATTKYIIDTPGSIGYIGEMHGNPAVLSRNIRTVCVDKKSDDQ